MSDIPNPSRKGRDFHGEQQMGFFWGERGYYFVDGPSGAAGHASNASGEDGLAFRSSPEDLLILDNKSFAARGNVSKATAIDPSVNLGQNLDRMIAKVQALPEMPNQPRVLTLLQQSRQSLRTNGNWPSSVRLVVMNAGGQSTGVTKRLSDLGVEFVDYNQVPVRPAPNAPQAAPVVRPRIGVTIGITVGESLLSIVFDLIASKLKQYLDEKDYKDKLSSLQPRIAVSKVAAYSSALSQYRAQELSSLYYNIKLQVTVKTFIIVAGTGSRNIQLSPTPEVLSVIVTKAAVNTASEVYEKIETAPQGHALMITTFTQFLTYSEPVAN